MTLLTQPPDSSPASALLEAARTNFGVAYTPRSRQKFLAAVRDRQSQLGLTSLSEYSALLRCQPGEWSRLWPLALTAEGAFFRPFTLFEVMHELLLEWSVMAQERCLRVLSLGCGPGFETVSLAITLEETGLRAKNWQVELYGLDLNPEAVTRAEQAVFAAADLDWLPKGYSQKWFTPRAAGFHFKTSLAPPTRLAAGNAFEPETWPFHHLSGAFDFIFCRELTWEAPPSALTQLAGILSRALAPSGFILTAPGEFLPDGPADLRLEERAGLTYYRRGLNRIKANRHHLTKKEKAGRPARDSFTAPLPGPLRADEAQLLAEAERQLAGDQPEAARDLAGEVMLRALDRRRPAPEAWALLARIEEALGRPASARATAEAWPAL
ncbi:MAG: hypothetical protein LBP55_08645 [Candidatus Adiutrix sp.]|nr:hypothetical protein [Candidatus Adiutrix sp.]